MIQEELEVYKIVIIGDTNTGKTNIAKRFVSNNYLADSNPTFSVQFLSKTVVVNNKKILVTIWDTAGQQRYRHLNKLYYKNALGVIIVYDITQPQSFRNIEIWIDLVNQNLDPAKYQMIILGNKIDLEYDRKIPFQTAKHWYQQKLNITCFEVSAKTNQQIAQSIMTLIERISQMMKKIKPIQTQQKQYEQLSSNLSSNLIRSQIMYQNLNQEKIKSKQSQIKHQKIRLASRKSSRAHISQLKKSGEYAQMDNRNDKSNILKDGNEKVHEKKCC